MIKFEIDELAEIFSVPRDTLSQMLGAMSFDVNSSHVSGTINFNEQPKNAQEILFLFAEQAEANNTTIPELAMNWLIQQPRQQNVLPSSEDGLHSAACESAIPSGSYSQQLTAEAFVKVRHNVEEIKPGSALATEQKLLETVGESKAQQLAISVDEFSVLRSLQIMQDGDGTVSDRSDMADASVIDRALNLMMNETVGKRQWGAIPGFEPKALPSAQ